MKYVDSHHHIHLFGPVFNAFVGPLAQRGISKLRLPMERPGRFFKRPALNLLSYFSRRKFQRSGFTFYPCFYPSSKDFERPARLAYQLSHMKGHEVIVHPSKFDDLLECGARDSYQAGRVEEYNSLTGLFPIR